MIDFGTEGNSEVIQTFDISRINYKDAIEKAGDFIGLDISVLSTGWLRRKNGVLTTGIFSLDKLKVEGDDRSKSKLRLLRRNKFEQFLIDLADNHSYDNIFIEDTINSCNYETIRELVELNCIADNLIDKGVLNIKQLHREDNKVWKANLRKYAGVPTKILGAKDKLLVKNSLEEIGYDLEELKKHCVTLNVAEKSIQDLLDVMGLVVGTSYAKFMGAIKKSREKVKSDITVGYKVKQLFSVNEALDYARGLKKEVYSTEFFNKRDLKYNFSKLVNGIGDKYAFVISTMSDDVGLLGIKKKLDLTGSVVYLVVYR
ncbi:hypothetical protein D3C81_10080 [compost metagenome]